MAQEEKKEGAPAGAEGTSGGEGEGEKNEFDQLKKAAEDMFTGEDFKVEAAKATMGKIIDAYKRKDEAAKRLLRESIDRKNKLRAMEKEKEDAVAKELKDKDEYKKLYDGVKPKYDALEQDFAKTTEFFDKTLASKLEEISDEHKTLIPEKLDVRDKIVWLENFIKTMKKTKPAESKTSLNVSGTGPADQKKEEGLTAEKKIAEELRAAKNPKELEAVLAKYRGSSSQ